MCICYYNLLEISTKNALLLRRVLKNHHLKLAESQSLVSCISSIHGHYMQVLSHLGTNIHKQSADSKPTSQYCLGRHLTRSQWDRPFVSPVSTLLLWTGTRCILSGTEPKGTCHSVYSGLVSIIIQVSTSFWYG